MAIVLGFSAYFHDSSACIVVNGKVVAAALEERFSRIKHDASFPEQAIDFCIRKAEISVEEIDEVVFFEKPFTKFERILETIVHQAPKGFFQFQKAMTSWLKTKMWVEDIFQKKYKISARFSYSQHHFSHAATVCYNSPYSDAAYLIVDGVGERACTSYGVFDGNSIHPIAEQRFPHSIGLLYSAFTQYCGFKVNSGEYKLMGLAPYGHPKYVDTIKQHFVQQSEDGGVQLRLANFGFLSDLQMINKRFENVFGRKKRKPGDPILTFHQDIAASIQQVCEELLLTIVNYVQVKTGKKNLLIGGGVALNCVANQMLVESSNFDQIFIHSASGDGGCAMGAALWRMRELGDALTIKNQVFLGPSFSKETIELELDSWGDLCYQELSEQQLFSFVAKELNENKIVAWFQGAMEFGPRALGNRSILANPSCAEMKQRLNQSIKKREGFRPFAPVILEEHFDEYFVRETADYSQMLYTAKVRQPEKIPACVHVDYTSRVQSLARTFNPKLYDLLTSFYTEAGIPVLINTSMNERGEPMVCTPYDALACFFATEIDVLVMDNFVIRKEENFRIGINRRTYELD